MQNPEHKTKRSKVNHGLTRTPEYKTWSSMKMRCYDKETKRYTTHGARGITVCDRWKHSPVNFINDMGKRPSKYHSLDRIDNNGNYEPSNCRWATIKEQANNKRSNVLLTYDNQTKNVTEWSNILGLKSSVIFKRIHMGWDTKRIIETPSLKRGVISPR